MATSAGIGFDIDDFSILMQKAKEADKALDGVVSKMQKLSNIRISGDIEQYLDRLLEMNSLVQGLNKNPLNIKIDTDKLHESKDALDNIAKTVLSISQINGEKLEFFDPQKIYATERPVALIKEDLKDTVREITRLDNKIKEVKKAQNFLSFYSSGIPEPVKESYKENFEPPFNEDKQKAWSKSSTAYKKAWEAHKKTVDDINADRKAQYTAQLKLYKQAQELTSEESIDSLQIQRQQQTETKAIIEKELAWAQKTTAEKDSLVEASIAKELKAEQDKVNAIIKEQQKLLAERKRIEDEMARYEAAEGAGKGLSDKEFDVYAKLSDERDKVNAQIQSNEKEHQKILTDIDTRATEERLRVLKELETRAYSKDEALALADSARTVKQMEAAQQALQSALKSADYIDEAKDIELLKKKHEELREKIEATTRTKQKDNTLEPSRRNEYAKTIKELEKLKNELKSLEEAEKDQRRISGTADDHSAIKASLQARIDALETEKQTFDQNNEQIIEEQKKFEAEKTRIAIEEYKKRVAELKAYEEKFGVMSVKDAQQVIVDTKSVANVRQAEEAVKNLKDARDKLDKKDAGYKQTLESLNKEIQQQEKYIQSVTNAEKYQAEQEKKHNETYDGAKKYAKQAKSLNELKKAMDYLAKAREKENVGSEKYQELSIELNKTKKEYEDYANTVKNSSKDITNITDRLKKSLLAAFSVAAIKGYINKLMEVRGEFELQQRSLQAILQNKEEADQLWSKTVALAIRSPFRIKELVTYTKQLAAYRIESSKLYDTTKMLADISAGLGVDMNRLILAFGQVRAASYLRGTELRQFTEAGIPLLEALADRFTELEGRAVSVGDVFARISKRMVDFEDVEAVLKSMTTEGGSFFRMQEIQAETLKGQISNLKDSLDVMLNDIGKSTEGVLKWSISLVRSFVENWERLVPILEAIAAAFILYKINALIADKALMRFAISQGKVLAGGNKLKKVLALLGAGFQKLFLNLKKGLTINPWIFAITSAIEALLGLIQWIGKANEAVEEQNAKYFEQVAAVNKVAIAYRDLIQEEKKEGANSDEIFEKKKEKLEELKKIASEKSVKFSFELGKIDKANIDTIVEQIRNEIIWAEDWGKEFGINLAKGLNAAQGGILGIHFFGDNLSTDLDQLDTAIEQMNRIGIKNGLTDAENEILNRYDTLPEKAREYFDILRQGKKEEETEQEYLERRVSFLDYINTKIKANGQAELKSAKEITKAVNKWVNVLHKRFEVEYELRKIVKDQLEAYGKENFSDLTKEEQFNVQLQIDKAFADMEVSDEIKRWAAMFMAQEFQIAYTIVPKEDPAKPLERWQEEYNEFIKNLETKSVKAITDAETSREKEVQNLESLIKEQQSLVDAFEQGGKSVNKAEYAEAVKILADLKKARRWIIGDVPEKGKKDKQAEIIKERVKLLKEMNQEYEKNLKYMTPEEAYKAVRDAYSLTASKIGLNLDQDWGQGRIEAIKDEIEFVNELKDAYSGLISEGLSEEAAKKALMKKYNLEFKARNVEKWIDDIKANLRKNEGFREEAYKDQGGVWTIGYGFTKDVSRGDTMSLEEAEERLDKEVNRHISGIKKAMKDGVADLNENQFKALADLAYQAGPGVVNKILKDAKGDMDYIAKALETAGTTIKGVYQSSLQGRADWRKALFKTDTNEVLLGEDGLIATNFDEQLSELEKNLKYQGQLSKEIKDLGQFTDEATIKALEDMLAKAKNYDEYMEIAKVLDNYRAEILNEIAQENQKALQKKIDDIFDLEGLTKELKDLGFSEDLAKTFGFEFIDLKEARKRIEALKDEAEKLGKDSVKDYEKSLEKLADLEDKYMKERMKTYSKYLMAGMSERVKIKLEEIKKLNEIESLAAKTNLSDEEKGTMISGVRRETNAALQKAVWDEFTQTDIYIRLFENLERASISSIDSMLRNIERYKDSLKDLKPADLKEIVSAMEKLKRIKLERNPFTFWIESAKKLKQQRDELYEVDAQGNKIAGTISEGRLNLLYQESEQLKRTYEERRDSNIDILKGLETEKTQLVENADANTKNTEEYQTQLTSLEEQIANQRALVAASITMAELQGKITKEYAKQLRAVNGLTDETKEGAEFSFKELADAAQSSSAIIGDLVENIASFGVAVDDTTKAVAATVTEVLSSVGSISSAAARLAANPADVGAYIQIAQGVFDIAASIVKTGDAIKDVKIQKQIEAVERLQKQYDKLQESIEEAYSTDELQRYAREEQNITDEQIRRREQALAEEKSKKQPDKENMKEQEAALEELYSRSAQDAKEFFSRATDGILDNVSDAARDFVDAWYDAFAETGDGLQGLEDNFDEMFMNLAKQQAAQHLVGVFVDQWKKDLKKYIDPEKGDLSLTKDETKKWAGEVKETLPQLDEMLEAYFDGIGLDSTKKGELTALQKGIQGITAEQSEVIQSYLNSLRMFVSANGEELRKQTNYLTKIYDLLDGLTTTSSAFAGKSWKTAL